MRTKNILLANVIALLLTASCAKMEKPTVKEVMSDPKQQEEVMDYIMNDYPLMMKFLDKCMSMDQPKSMVMGHRKMMGMMMCNSEMISEILKEDSKMCEDVLQNMIKTACKDSATCKQIIEMMVMDKHIKGMLHFTMMNESGVDKLKNASEGQNKLH